MHRIEKIIANKVVERDLGQEKAFFLKFYFFVCLCSAKIDSHCLPESFFVKKMRLKVVGNEK